MAEGGKPRSPPDPVATAMAAVFDDLVSLHREMVEAGQRKQSCLERIHPDHRTGARNLLHYLEMRRQDLRRLQTRLAELGLSSLGRAEVHALDNVEAVLELVRHRLARPWPERGPDARQAENDRADGYARLAAHAGAMFGPVPDRRDVRIMVTMPRAAADDPELIGRLMAAGMDLIRINTGHDEP
ncbi:MAG: pyruvate kinase, partial [Planctomycetota bacterium]